MNRPDIRFSPVAYALYVYINMSCMHTTSDPNVAAVAFVLVQYIYSLQAIYRRSRCAVMAVHMASFQIKDERSIHAEALTVRVRMKKRVQTLVADNYVSQACAEDL